MAARWEQWQVALSNNSRYLKQHQDEITRQADLVGQVLRQLTNLGEFQTAINHNLESLTASTELQRALSQLTKFLERFEQSGVDASSDHTDQPARFGIVPREARNSKFAA
jgi:hypothetical protein